MELITVSSNNTHRVLDTQVQFRRNNSAASLESLKRNYLHYHNHNKRILIIHMITPERLKKMDQSKNNMNILLFPHFFIIYFIEAPITSIEVIKS